MKITLRKILSIMLVVAVLVTFSGITVSASDKPEVKGIWLSFLEMQTMLTGKSESQFTANISEAFDNIKNFGLNTIYVQVRPYGDALYSSAYFPWSHIATGEEGVSPGFDPLTIMVKEAHSRSLKIEAWINPYRIRPEGNTKALCDDNQAQKWLDSSDRAVIKQGGIISYNPASTKAQDLIVKGAQEIIKNYKVDGIHIDDYFYPVTSVSFDKVDYDAYTKKGGTLSHANWRRSNVETLIKKLNSGIKAINPKARFGISPQSNIQKNYSEHYIDVKKIASSRDYCDYIIPQIYFGFDHVTQPYGKLWDSWNQLLEDSEVDLYVGVASYKVGKLDSYAGSGKNEWVNNSDRTSKMVSYAKNGSSYGGFVLYRYDHIFRPENSVKSVVNKENTRLKSLISQ